MVYKRGRRWHYAFRVDGKRYRRAIPEARTKWQAEQAETKARDDVFAGRYGAEQKSTTLREFVEKVFLPWSRKEKKSWRNDVSRSKPILAFFGNKRLREISRFNVEQFKNERRSTFNGRGKLRAPATVNRELELLSRIFSLAIEREELEINPCRGVKRKVPNNLVTRYLSHDEEERLMSVLIEPRAHLQPIVLLALKTGMRLREILLLHRSQVDLQRGALYLTNTKSGEPRAVPIHDSLRPLLIDLCATAPESGHLFCNPATGKPRTEIKNSWRSALKAAGIEGLRFHDLRHTFGTRAIDAGARLPAVKEVMGHADIKTTMRYVHATDSAKRDAVDAAVRGGQHGNVAAIWPQSKMAAG